MERRILWFDCTAGAVGGILMLLVSGWLAPRFGLPRHVLVTTALCNLAYAAFSFSLAKSRVPARGLLLTLVVANFAWTFVCIAIALRYASAESVLGVVYIVLEGLVVGALAAVEARIFGFVGRASGTPAD